MNQLQMISGTGENLKKDRAAGRDINPDIDLQIEQIGIALEEAEKRGDWRKAIRLEDEIDKMKSEEREQIEMFLVSDSGSLEVNPPAQAHSETSLEAAESILESCNRLQRDVYDLILSRGKHGATDDEIQEALGMNPSTERPRRIELDRKGLIRGTDEKRKTRTGRKATVWVAREALAR